MAKTLTAESLANMPKGFASCSIGSPVEPNFSLQEKLSAISKAGFEEIELSFPDLLGHAKRLEKREVAADDYDTLCKAAADAKGLCEQYQLRIFILQPFANFEGWLPQSSERKEAFNRLNGWIRIMHACGTDMLQVGSSDSEGISKAPEVVASDLRELADILAKHSFRAAYENWAWSTHAPRWKEIWEITKMVDRPNFGLNLDTFQSAGLEWADPRTESGLVEGITQQERAQRWKASLKELAETVPGNRIFFLQISDAYKPPSPIEDRVVDELWPRARWSHYYRPLPYSGGYLPVVEFTKAVLQTGFSGTISIETFDGGPDGKGNGATDLDAYAKQAMVAYKRLLKDCLET